MKKIFRIAKTELQTLFYSPVAWLILIIFTFQVAMVFTGIFVEQVSTQEMGYGLYSVTYMTFTNTWNGVFMSVQQYLYLYVPLLTMSLMSREFGSGSIKLLYSSPVTNWQIILGKFLSMMLYGLVLMEVLLVFIIFGLCTVKDFDLPAALTGVLGLYLLLCAYAAIGLFMSSLTSYQVVAAILTLAMLGMLNYIKYWWQDLEFVRDITYWLSISGRADEFIQGLICSEDLLYFIIVSILFLFLAVIRLQAVRQKVAWTVTLGKFVGVLLVACLLGYFSSRPQLMTYYDATATKMNTLTKNSQDVIAKLEGGLTITTYVNVLDEQDIWTAIPRSVKEDQERFRQYRRFKPEIEMKYVYYYDTIHSPEMDERWPDLNTEQRAKKMMEMWQLDSNLFLSPAEIRAQIDLFPEGNKFVRLLERETGEKTFLRVFNDMEHHPREEEITAAFKRIAMKLPKVGFLTGHGERDIHKTGDRDYNSFVCEKPFRYALINQGFDVTEITLEEEIPLDIRILVIAELRENLDEREWRNLDQYIDRGGNLLILNEPRRSDYMKPLLDKFGVKLVPGELVRVTEDYSPDLIQSSPTKKAGEMIYHFNWLIISKQVLLTPGVSGLDYSGVKDYESIPLFVTDSLVWNELETTNFVDDTVYLTPHSGELQQRYTTGLALTRVVGDKNQKIVILGDADCFSNGELNRGRKGIPADNYSVINGTFFWLSDNEVPIDTRRPNPPDDKIYLTSQSIGIWKVIMMWVLPSLMLIFTIILWFRRRGR